MLILTLLLQLTPILLDHSDISSSMSVFLHSMFTVPRFMATSLSQTGKTHEKLRKIGKSLRSKALILQIALLQLLGPQAQGHVFRGKQRQTAQGDHLTGGPRGDPLEERRGPGIRKGKRRPLR